MECPKCAQEIGRSKYCGCGWNLKMDFETPSTRPFGYPQCEWEADTKRCRYPGTVAHTTNGKGPWYCSTHAKRPDGALGAQIVEQSYKYQLPTEDQRIQAHQRWLNAPHAPKFDKNKWVPYPARTKPAKNNEPI